MERVTHNCVIYKSNFFFIIGTFVTEHSSCLKLSRSGVQVCETQATKGLNSVQAFQRLKAYFSQCIHSDKSFINIVHS